MTNNGNAVAAPKPTYAEVYSRACGEEAARPVNERTQFSHVAGANGVASYALLDLALALEEARDDVPDVVAFIRAQAEALPGTSSTLARHAAVTNVVQQMTPAYAAWVTCNSPAVMRRLEEMLGDEQTQLLLDEFYITPKAAG